MAQPSHPAGRLPRGTTPVVTAHLVRDLTARALAHHRQGNFKAAEELYGEALALDPRHADTLHLLGLLAHQVGRSGLAVEFIKRAIDIDNRQAVYHSNLALVERELGWVGPARASLLQALALDPSMVEARLNLSVLLCEAGEYPEAEQHLRRLLTLRPNLAGVHLNLGNLLQSTGRMTEAIACYEKAISLDANLIEAHSGLGSALAQCGEHERAIVCYQHVIALRPSVGRYHFNLGASLQALGRLPEAFRCYDEALALDPACAEAHNNRGFALLGQGVLDEAQACFIAAIAVRPQYAEAYYNLGCVLEEKGDSTAAIARMEEALRLRPDYPQARFGLAQALLRDGQWQPGWHAYGARWQSPDHKTAWRAFPVQQWRGQPMEGRLLLWPEQGVGDEVQFAGMVPELMLRGMTITLAADPRLVPLFHRSFPGVDVVSVQEPLPTEIVAHLPVGSLPGLLRTSEADFHRTHVPYLRPDPEQVAELSARYRDGRPRVGLAWKTVNQLSGRHRSVTPAQLAPLFQTIDARWISLQYGPADVLEAELSQTPVEVDRAIDSLIDLDAFAAQVAAMDMIVTIDNSVAHFAGALGVPTLVLLPHYADWRWLRNRSDSPWYPSLTLLRQAEAGNWQPVIDAACAWLGARR